MIKYDWRKKKLMSCGTPFANVYTTKSISLNQLIEIITFNDLAHIQTGAERQKSHKEAVKTKCILMKQRVIT